MIPGRYAGMPEWPKGADCKSAGCRLRRFKSFSRHSVGFWNRATIFRPLSSVVEHRHGKAGVPGSIPGEGSARLRVTDGLCLDKANTFDEAA